MPKFVGNLTRVKTNKIIVHGFFYRTISTESVFYDVVTKQTFTLFHVL